MKGNLKKIFDELEYWGVSFRLGVTGEVELCGSLEMVERFRPQIDAQVGLKKAVEEYLYSVQANQKILQEIQEIKEPEIAAKKFIERLKVEGISWQISDERMQNGDIELHGTNKEKVKRYQEILDKTPKLKAALILSIAVHDKERIEAIEMSASRRWSEGYSDSLLSLVLANLGAANDYHKKEKWPVTDHETEELKYRGLLIY